MKGYLQISKVIGMSLSKLRELVMDRKAWRAAIHGVSKSRTRLSDLTELKVLHYLANKGPCSVFFSGHAWM